jgi:hypothetical protein
MKLWVRIITTLNKWWFSSIVILSSFFILSTIGLIFHIIGCSLTENCNSGDFLDYQALICSIFSLIYIFFALVITLIIYIFDFFKNIKSIFKYDRFTNNFGNFSIN